MALKTARHSLLLVDKEELSRQRHLDLSYKNKYTFRGESISTLEQRKSALEYIESIFNYNEKCEFDNLRFNQLKRKIKKWSCSKNSKKIEMELFNKLIELDNNSSSKSISCKKALLIFDNIKDKLSRFNDKRRAISEYIELLNIKSGSGFDSTSQMNVRMVELIFKIPLRNEIDLDAEVQEDIVRSYFSENFSEFEEILSIIHYDETTAHVHYFIDAMNKNSNECNFVQKQYEFCLNKFGLNGFPERNSELEADQVRYIGELLQDDFYNFTNDFLKNKNIDIKFSQLELTEDELVRREKIKKDTSKRITDREYNTANYYKKLADSALRYVTEILKPKFSNALAKRKAQSLAQKVVIRNVDYEEAQMDVVKHVSDKEKELELSFFKQALAKARNVIK